LTIVRQIAFVIFQNYRFPGIAGFGRAHLIRLRLIHTQRIDRS